MISAVDEEKNPGLKIKHDPNAAVKKNLMDLLNSKASTEELIKLNMEKTNKIDMDMQMKCIDILHN